MKKAKFALLLALLGNLFLASCTNGENSSIAESSSTASEKRKEIPSEVTNRVNDLLGSYQELEYSPLPYLEKATYTLDQDDEETIIVSDVNDEDIIDYYALLSKKGFTSKGNGYLDPLQRYIVSYPKNEDGTYNLEISFNDEAGEFPVNFISTCTSSIDVPSYMNPDTFMAAENDPNMDLSKKFLTFTKRVVSGANVYRSKYVSYTPKSNDDSPLATLDDWLEDSGFSRVSSSYYIYSDSFYSCLVYSGLVKDGSFALREKGAKIGDVYLQFVHSWTEELDQEALKGYYEESTGYEYPSEDFPDWTTLGKAHGLTLTYSYSSSYYGPGWVIAGANKTAFQNILDTLFDNGWSYSQTNISYATLFNFYGPKYQYRIYMSYYDHTKIGGLISDICQIRLFGFPSVYDGMKTWFKNNNAGGGEVTDVPELPCVGLKGSSTVSSSSAIPSYSLSGRNITAEGYAKYVAALKEDGWVLDSENSTESIELYVSECGFYTFYLSFDAKEETVAATIYYDSYHYSGQVSYASLMEYAAKRFSVTSLSVPTLETELSVIPLKTLNVLSLFYTYQRFMFYVPYDSNEAATAAYNKLMEAITLEDSGWEYVGKNTYYSFYQNSDKIYLYSAASSSTLSDGSSSYYWFVGLYIDN